MRVLSFILTLLALNAAAQTLERFDIYRFAIPQGWVRQEQNGIAFIRPQTLSSGQAVIIALSPSQALTGEFRAWFDNRIRSLHSGQEVLGSSPVESSRAEPEGYAVLAKYLPYKN